MTKQEFMQQLTELLADKYADLGWHMECHVFLKNNDTRRHGIMFQPTGNSIAPTIYVDDFYDDYISKKSTLPEITEQIQDLMKSVIEQSSKFERLAIDFDSCKSKIIYRLVSLEKNRHLLKGRPYLPFLDFAITFHIMYNLSPKGLETISITEQLMEKWQVGVKELMVLAQENTPRIFPPQIQMLPDLLADYLGEGFRDYMAEEEERPQILILTNKQGINGASALLYKDLLKNIVAPYERDFYIIPSSIHEFLLMPQFEEAALGDISKIVKQINKDHVRTDEILSDHAYLYNWKEEKFSF